MTKPTKPGSGQAGREFRMWPIPVCTLVLVLLGIIAVQPFGYWLGTSPDGTVDREGTARIQSCEPSMLYLNLVQECVAQVRWTRSLETAAPRELDEPPVDRTVYSLEPLSGTVQVVDRCPSRDEHCTAVPDDHPNRPGLSFVPILICIVLGIIGLVLGIWLAGRISGRQSTASAE